MIATPQDLSLRHVGGFQMTVAKAMALAASILVSTLCCSGEDKLDPYPLYRSTKAAGDIIEIPPRDPSLPPKQYDKPFIGPEIGRAHV